MRARLPWQFALPCTALVAAVTWLVSGCGAVSGAATGKTTTSAPTPARARPSAPGATPATPLRMPECAQAAGEVTLLRTCQLTMSPGTTLTVTVQWPFRLDHVAGDAIRVHKMAAVPGDGQRIRLTAVKPGNTIITATTPPNAAAGAPSGLVRLYVTVSG